MLKPANPLELSGKVAAERNAMLAMDMDIWQEIVHPRARGKAKAVKESTKAEQAIDEVP